MTELIELKRVLDKALGWLAEAKKPTTRPDMRDTYIAAAYDVLDAKRKLTQTQIDLMDGDMTALMREGNCSASVKEGIAWQRRIGRFRDGP